ncbi:FAD-dependent monooxygenase [Lysobacter humi (ex Lee et al. 2017)]
MSADVLVIGAGPAGTSAALALRDCGIGVRLVDAGRAPVAWPPAGEMLSLRFADAGQQRWQLGADFESLAAPAGNSPKLRVPGFQGMFRDYARENCIVGEDGFQVVGALAAGGLSNAWGCGVAAFDDRDLEPLDADERAAMRRAYARVATRMGISGRADDALADRLGIDAWADPGVALDPLMASLLARSRALPAGLYLGRARVAVTTRARDGRESCDLSGMCLWGCARRATWNAAWDLQRLQADPGVHIIEGWIAERLVRDGAGWRVEGRGPHGHESLRADRVLLAAGTLATTRLALTAMADPPQALALQSNPMAAFLLALPRALGRCHDRAFGLAQLSFALDDPAGAPAFGNLFSTAGLPVSEFLEHMPVPRAAALPLLRALLPASIVGNVFLPGAWSRHRLTLRGSDLHVQAGHAPDLPQVMERLRSRLAVGFRRTGAWMLPSSFVVGAPGADIHYASTLPMRRRPAPHECATDGQVAALPGVYAVDGASLPTLPERAHTLSIMANADRIARRLAGG